MTAEPFTYEGSELQVFAGAVNWRRYWCSKARPYVGARVLEVGAGIGSVTDSLWSDGVTDWLAVEPDPELAARIESRAGANERKGLRAVCGTLADVDAESRFDTVVYIDVLEHIEDAKGEAARAAEHLVRGGHFIVLSPAHQFLFSPFDAAIGHFRRYNKRSISAIRPSGCTEVVNDYLDSVGLLASLANRALLRSASPTRGQIALWDTRLVPVSRRIDRLFRHTVGKSLLTVWRKD